MVKHRNQSDFSTFIAVNAILSILVGLAAGRNIDTKDDCPRLPPPSPTIISDNNQNTNTSVNGNVTAMNSILYENNIESILNQGLNQLSFEDHNRTAIFILGNTGSGKTTLSLTINGNLSKIHAVKTHSGNIVIVDDDEKIGAPSTTSKTLVPEYIVNPNNSVAFYDCPGFDDNRGPELDLAAMYFVKAIMKHVTRAKFLFTATYSSMIIGNDRNSFDLLMKHAAKFLKHMGKMTDAVGLIVTKVDNFDSMGYYQDDDQIIEQIAGFLEVHLVALQNRLRMSDSTFMDTDEIIVLGNKIKFIKSLLHQDETGHYTKIWFLRNPPGCGPFSTIPYVYEVRTKIINMYSRNLTYANVSRDDFGWTLKDTTLLKLRDTIVPSIEAAVIQSTNETLQTLADTYFKKFETGFNKSGSSDQVEAIIGLQKIYNNLTDQAGSWNEGLNIAEKVTNIAATVEDVPPSEIFLNGTRRREDWLNFFYELMGNQNAEDNSNSNSNDDHLSVNTLINSTLNEENNLSGPTEEVRKPNLSSTTLTFTLMLQPFHNFYSQFRLLHDGVRETVLREILPNTKVQMENVTADILNNIYNQYALQFTEDLKRDGMGAMRKFKRDYESIITYSKVSKHSQHEETSLSAQVGNLHRNVFHPGVNFDFDGDSNHGKLQSMEANFLRLIQFAGVTEQAESFQPSFTSPFIENIVKPFQSLMTHILANVKEKIIPDLFGQIEVQARNILTGYMKTFGEEIQQLLTTTGHQERRTGIEMLEKSSQKITELLQVSTMNISRGTKSISNTIESIFNNGEVDQLGIDSLRITESKLRNLADVFEIDTSTEMSSILKNVLLGYSLDIRALRNEVHSSIRDEYIPELLNHTLSSASEILTELQKKYFKIMEDALKPTSDKDDTVAAAVRIHRSYKNLQNLGSSFSVNQKESISSSSAAISKIVSALGVSFDSSIFLDEMNEKADLFGFYQNVTNSTKATGEAAATRLGRVINNFLSEFNRLHTKILGEIRQKLIPETRQGIQQFYHAFLEGIRENYFSSYNNLIGDESTKIDAVKTLYVHCHKLDAVKENFANGTWTPLGIVENLENENGENTNWEIFWLYFLSSAFGNPMINPADIFKLTSLESRLKIFANITNEISEVSSSKEEKADEFRDFFRQFKRTCEDEKTTIKTKLIPQKLQNFQSAMSGILRKVTGQFLEPLNRILGSSVDKRKIFDLFKSYYVGLGKFLESDKDNESKLVIRLDSLIRTVFPEESKSFNLDAEIESIRKLETETLIFLVATGSEKGQLATEYMKTLQTSFEVEVNQPMQAKKSEIDKLARDILVPDLIKQIRQGAVKHVNSFLDMYKADFNQKLKARGPPLREAYKLLEVDSHIAKQIVDHTQNFINNNPTSTIRSVAAALKEIVYPNFQFSKKFSEDHEKPLMDAEDYLDSVRQVVPSDRATEKVHILKDVVSHLQNQLDSYRDEIRLALKEKTLFMQLFCTEESNKWNCNYPSTLGTVNADYLKWA